MNSSYIICLLPQNKITIVYLPKDIMHITILKVKTQISISPYHSISETSHPTMIASADLIENL
jgi:hypothetical protein